MTSQQRGTVPIINYYPDNWKRQLPLKSGFFTCAQNPSAI